MGAEVIARIWRGRVRKERADEYEKYNYDVGIKPLIEKALGVQTFREDREHESEFLTISYWESIEAMSRFTGGDPARIHHLDRDRVSDRAAQERAGAAALSFPRQHRRRWLTRNDPKAERRTPFTSPAIRKT